VRGDAAGTRPRGAPFDSRFSPGFTDTEFIASTRDPDELAALTARRDAPAMPPVRVAGAIAFVIAQPEGVDVGEILVRPTVQP
jgi:NADP-dependent 3-hydroxy acid dehydrogenase YdfG